MPTRWSKLEISSTVRRPFEKGRSVFAVQTALNEISHPPLVDAVVGEEKREVSDGKG